jgi:cobalt-zinc-cadmium efflux system outer membrane protein
MRFMSVCAVLAIGCLTAFGAENDSASAEGPSSPYSAPREWENGVPLTLQEAIHRALAESPDLAAKRWDVEISGAGVIQAGLRPNPELSLEIEDIRWERGPSQRTRTRSLSGGLGSGSLPTLGREFETESGTHSGFTEAEITLSIAQLIELGGKRAKRIAEAEEAKQLTLWDYEALRADVIAETARAFVAVVAAQKQLELESDLLRLAEEMVRTFQLRVQAGQESPIEAAKADVALENQRIVRDRAERTLGVVRTQLAAMWGEETPHFGPVEGDLEDLPELPAFDDLRTRVSGNPDIARWTAELAARKATLELARANRIPDATVELGFRSTGLADSAASNYGLGTDGEFSAARSKSSFDSGRDNTLLVAFSIPLPIFHRNQGDIAAAQFGVSQVPDSNRAVAMRVHSDLAAAHEEAASSFSEVLALRKNVLPRSAEIFEKTQTGYRQGKFDYLDLLDAQRTLFEVQTAYLAALERGHLALIALERLTGTALAQCDTASLHEMEETEHAH